MKKEQPILSICIPTYNRGELLIYTLTLFKEQILRNQGKVELIVCDNASTDETSRITEKYSKKESFFTYRRYEEHLDSGGDSVIRATENATGTFMLMYGDDDIPMPYMVDTILNCINKYPDIGYIGFNRLRGNSCEEGNGIENIHVAGRTMVDNEVIVYDDISGYAEEHQNEVGFVSTNIVRTNLWKQRYHDVYPNNHRGYEFILPYLYSAKGYKAIYIQYPLCIQRTPAPKGNNGAQTWADKRLLYFYLGRPRAIFAQEKYGIVTNAKELFESYEKQFGEIFMLSQLLCIHERCSEVYDSVDEILSFLSSPIEQEMVKKLIKAKGLKKIAYKIYFKTRIMGISYIKNKIKRLFIKSK